MNIGARSHAQTMFSLMLGKGEELVDVSLAQGSSECAAIGSDFPLYETTTQQED
jgi:hypothetical protein